MSIKNRLSYAHCKTLAKVGEAGLLLKISVFWQLESALSSLLVMLSVYHPDLQDVDECPKMSWLKVLVVLS